MNKFSTDNSQLAKTIDLLQEVKAEKITIVESGEESTIADWIIICEGTSFVHVRAISDKIREYFKKEENMLPYLMEGKDESRWVLLDYTDVVVNIMLKELRDFYRLEELWSAYPQTEIEG
jgi:ribosome-associated protein